MMLQIEINSEVGLPEKERLLTADSRERYQWLIDHTPISDSVSFPGGKVSLALFKASRYCFVYGHFPASLVLGLSYIEKTIGGWFVRDRRPELEKAGLGTLIQKSLIVGLIDEESYDILNRARHKRNLIPPFYRPDESWTMRKEILPESAEHFTIGDDDVRQLLGVMMHILHGKIG
jgi:hypothetical protein